MSGDESTTTMAPVKSSTPATFLRDVVGKGVVVKLSTGMEYRGKLACVDGFMNVVLQNTEVYSQGKLKRKYNDAFIRGNNVAYISVKKAQ